MKTAIILLLLICSIVKGQNELPSEYILKGDTITLEISKIGCNNSYSSIYRFSKTKNSLIEVHFLAYHPIEYYYTKNEVAKYYRDSTKLFLKKNNIKLNQYYNISQKPLETIIGSSGGLYCNIISDISIDSINYYPLSILSEIETLYEKVINDKLFTDGLIIAGDWTEFNFYSITKDKKRIKGWYDFHILTKKTK
ncbi:MAG: hypothetical protein V4511_05350 [Bacteroidota bacterium]